jgi:hypothetical protein
LQYDTRDLHTRYNDEERQADLNLYDEYIADMQDELVQTGQGLCYYCWDAELVIDDDYPAEPLTTMVRVVRAAGSVLAHEYCYTQTQKEPITPTNMSWTASTDPVPF